MLEESLLNKQILQYLLKKQSLLLRKNTQILIGLKAISFILSIVFFFHFSEITLHSLSFEVKNSYKKYHQAHKLTTQIIGVIILSNCMKSQVLYQTFKIIKYIIASAKMKIQAI